MPWSRKLTQPIVLKDGRTIATLGDAREIMLTLRNLRYGNPHWPAAAEMLARAVDSPSAMDDASAAMLRALKADGLI